MSVAYENMCFRSKSCLSGGDVLGTLLLGPIHCCSNESFIALEGATAAKVVIVLNHLYDIWI
jgi:hypothetical protein